MKKFVKIISLILALLMITAAFASCGKKDDGDEKGTQSSDTVAQTSNDGTTVEQTTKVPDVEVINWNGKEYRILGKLNTMWSWGNSFEVSRDEMPEDVVGKAVWNRNKDIEDNYGIKVKGFFESSYNAAATTALDAGEDLYDLLLISPESYLNLALKGQLLDLLKLKYINTAHETWTPFINEQFTMGGKMYYTSNKFMLQEKNRFWMLCYNRDMAKELNLGRLEEFVFNGTWTIDKAKELAKKATADNDGQPGLGKGDRWGIGCGENYAFSHFSVAAGFRFAKIGADGYPELLGPTDQMMAILDKTLDFFTDKTLFWCDVQFGPIDYNDCANHMFYRGNMLLVGSSVCELEDAKEAAEFEYGILPLVKYDENQERYHTTPNLLNGSLLGVPATVAEPDFAGYALELISEKSVNTSYPAFIESRCKLQNAPDEDAAKCLDLVFNGIVYDLCFINSIGNFDTILTSTLPSNGTNTYNRLYTRLSNGAELEIQKIRDTFSKLEY